MEGNKWRYKVEGRKNYRSIERSKKDVEGRKKVGRENMRKVTFYLRLVILTRDQNSVRELQENI
jgi:hypothetical protein